MSAVRMVQTLGDVRQTGYLGVLVRARSFPYSRARKTRHHGHDGIGT
jgi:hypothetical protein